MDVKRKLRSPLICCICGSVARGMNFNVISCMSCRAFFRRNALRQKESLRCARKFQCEITKAKRTNCAACRLKKCLAFGMKPQLIRAFAQPLDLLQDDRSTLTADQWNLISNITHTFDEQNSIDLMKRSLIEKSSLPVKLRGKPSFALDLMEQCVAQIEPIMKRSLDFQSLSVETRGTLIAHNSMCTSIVHGMLINREINYLKDSNFTMSFNGMYESDHLQEVVNVIARVNLNATALKLMLFVLTFSSNTSLVQYDSANDTNTKSASINSIHIQNVYVTVLWKYLLHQYGFIDAVRHYSSLIKTILDMYSLQGKLRTNEFYEKMIDTTVKRIAYSLVIEQ